MARNETQNTHEARMQLCYEILQMTYEESTGNELIKHRPKKDFDDWLVKIKNGRVSLTAKYLPLPI